MALEHRESVGLANPRVVGDLVVAHEGGVADRHALDDVGHQQRRDEVAHDHGDRGADERVQAAPVDMRGAAAALADGRPALVRDVGQRQHDRAQEPVGIGEVGEQVPGLGSSAVADDAHRGRAAWRVAREHVPPARARGGQQTLAGRVAGARSRPRRRDDWRPACDRTPSHTSGRRACPSCFRAAGRPGSPRSGRRDRTPSRGFDVCQQTASARSWARVHHALPHAGPSLRVRRSRTGSRRGHRCDCVGVCVAPAGARRADGWRRRRRRAAARRASTRAPVRTRSPRRPPNGGLLPSTT